MKTSKKSAYIKALAIAGFFLFFFSFSSAVHAAGPTVTTTANGVPNLLTISQGTQFTISWVTSPDATFCTIDRNGQSLGGFPVNGSLGPIDSSHPFYPTSNQAAIFTVNCSDGVNTVSNSVTVALSAPLPPVLSTPNLSGATGAQCGGQIDLSWNSVSNATSYLVNRDGVQIAQTVNNTFTDTGLAVGSSHTYTVIASDGTNLSSASNPVGVFASSACSGSVQQTVFNTDPADFATVRVSNFSQFPFSTMNWVTSVNANPGDIVTVGIYYHNSGAVNALNTIVGISVPVGVSQSNFTVSGGVSADNASNVGGSATISLPSNQTLTFIPGSAKLYPNQSQNPAQAITLPDYASNNIGTIAPGFPSQGMVIAQFQVSSGAGTSTPLAAPVLNGSTGAQCGGNIDLSWGSVTGATVYKIFRNSTLIGSTASTSFTDIGLTSGQTYSYSIVASNGVSDSPASNTVNVVASAACSVPPQAPTGVVALTGPQCGGQIVITWNQSTNASSYKVFRNGVQIGTTANLSFTDAGLNPGQSYSYTIVATNNLGDSAQSAPSSAISSTQCGGGPGSPTTPTSVTAITGPQCGGQTIISWTPVANTLTYKILRDGIQISVISASTTSYVDNGLAPGSVHTYSVVASNAQGDSAPSVPISASASAQCSGPFAGPPLSGVTNNNCGGGIVLSWSQVAGASSYQIFRSTGGSAFSQVGTTTNLSFTDSGLIPSASYQYYVIATVGGVDSAPSNTVTVLSSAACTVPPPAPVLTGLTGPSCGGQIVLNWTASPGATSYNIFRNGVLLASTSVLSFTDTVAPSTAFSYTVQAVNNFGSSPNSNTVIPTSSVVCGGGGGGATTTPIVTLTANPSSIPANASTTLTWISSNSTFCSAIGGWTAATSTSGSQILSVGTTTTFGITCTGPGGASTATTTVTIVAGVAPAAPTALVALTGAQCGGTIDLTWTASAGATYYGIYRGGTLIATTSATSFTDTLPTTGNPFSYTVNAVNIFGTSGSSNPASAFSSAPCSTGGGGGGGGGGGAVFVSPVPVLSGGGGGSPTQTTGIYQCDYLHDYLRIDFQNNPIEVMKLQIFLKNIEGESGLAVNGVFDQSVFDAVSRFQIKYQPDILTPWGYAQGESTGYVYILTKKKINEIVCDQILSLTPDQQNEIAQFKDFLNSLKEHGISVPAINSNSVSTIEQNTTTASTTGIVSTIINNNTVKNVAAALFAAPQGFRNTLKAISVFLLVLIAAYVVAEEIIKRYLKTTDKDSERLRRLAIVVGFLAGAIAVAAILKYFVIILPLIILIFLLVLFSAWVIWKKRQTDNTNKMKGFGAIPPSVIVTPPPAQQA